MHSISDSLRVFCEEPGWPGFREMRRLFVLLLCVGVLSIAGMATNADSRGKGFASLEAPVAGGLDLTFSHDGKLFDFFLNAADDEIYATALQPDGKIVVAGTLALGAVHSCGVSRYNGDGTIDTTFDGDGHVVVPGRDLTCRSVAIQADGKIVVAGYSDTPNFAVGRLNPDGSPDTSFGTGGVVTTRVGQSDNLAFDVKIQPDGKIVMAGTSQGDFALVRYNPDGTLDASFDSDGIVITLETGGSARAYAVALQPDGKIVAAGNYGATMYEFALNRYNSDGSLDTSFDGDGKITTPMAISGGTVYALEVQPDGKIVAAGYTAWESPFPPAIPHTDFAVARYNSDGSLDGSFDFDGKVIINVLVTTEMANALALQTDGKVVIAGYRRNTSSEQGDFAVVRLNTDGSLDTTFDLDGKVFTAVGAGDDRANGLAIQPDGKIIATGYSYSDGGLANDDFALVRYNPNGSVDTSFSSDGIAKDNLGYAQSMARAVAVQADGKFVVSGYTRNLNGLDFALVRYNADGAPDTSFGTDGKIVTAIPGSDDEICALAVQADGKIVAAGRSWVSPNADFRLVRYTTSGTLDTTFDLDGTVTTSVGDRDDVAAMAIQPDGKIIAAGTSNYVNFTLVRYNTDGSLDTSFDADGKVITPVGELTAAANALAIQADGKIVVAGHNYVGHDDHFALVRYNKDGSLDHTFDSDGILISPAPGEDSIATGVAIQSDGKIVASGYTRTTLSTGWLIKDFTVARYNTNGSLDTSFDVDGRVTTPVLAGMSDQANALAIQADGKILVGGSSGPSGYDNHFAIVRYNTDGSLDTDFDGDGKFSFEFLWGRTNEHLYAMALDQAGRAIVVGDANEIVAVARILTDAANVRSPFDYDGDGRTDISIFRPSDGAWYLNQSTDGFRGMQFGVGTDKIAPADYDGDGKTDIAVYRPSDGVWFIVNSSNSTVEYRVFGLAEDRPAPADYDGDGKADICVFRPSTGTWYLQRSFNGSFFGIQFGLDGDRPTVGDFDGDGKADIGIWRPSNGDWYHIRSSNGSIFGERFGISTDKMVPADYDGDGKTDIAVWRPSSGTWYIKQSSDSAYVSFLFGLPTDIPAPGDFDGDGKADRAVFRPSDGTWYITNSTNGSFTIFPWGQNGDVPTPSAFE